MNCFHKKETICVNCVNAVPNPDTGAGCSWSRSFEPVEGWTAKKTLIVNREFTENEEECTIPSYRVDACPMFRSDEDQYAKPIRGKLKKGVDPYSMQALRCSGQKVAPN
jgi:hypothetical protein